jgi:hypothetical protein
VSRLMHRRWVKVLVICFSTGILLSVNIQAAEAPLPIEAQKAFERGLIAADQQAWELAIGYFAEAQKAAERDPGVLYSLGLAHTNAGHALAGAAWLRAYLSAAPQSSNADAVEKEIVRLEDIAKANTKKIFEAALAASHQTPSDEMRKQRLFYIFTWQIYIGDLDGGQKTQKEAADLWVALSPDEAADIKSFLDSLVWEWHVRYLAQVGEVQKAQEALSRVDDWKMKIEAECSIAQGQTWIGDFAGAEKTLLLTERALRNLDELCRDDIQKGRYKNSDDPSLREDQTELLFALAEAYAVNGQAEDFRRVLKEANEIAEQYKLSKETRSKIADALQSDPDSKNRRVALIQMDPVKEWIDLAVEMSTDNVVIDLPGRLAWAKSDESSDGIANRLAAVAFTLGKRLNKIYALEKRCGVAATRHPMAAALQPSLLSVLQFRLALDQPADDSEEMPLIDSLDSSRKRNVVIYVEKEVLLDGRAVKTASAVRDKVSGRPYVSITFTEEGAKQFAQVTREFIGERLAIISDGQVYSAPVIQQEISGGTAQIQGDFTLQEANDFAKKINEAITKVHQR